MGSSPERILMVCTGNICRSPTMEGVWREVAASRGWKGRVDSAGTVAWHAGEPPDPRTLAAARARGYELGNLRARAVAREDFLKFDLILAADLGHVARLRAMAPAEARSRIRLFLGEAELPDPYYGGPEGFEAVLDAVEARCRAWDGSASFF